MLFNSLSFLFLFLPLTLAGFFLCGRLPALARLLFLSTASLIFYAVWSLSCLWLFLFSIGMNFGFGLLIRKTRLSAILWIGISANLLIIAIFKYTNFIVDNFNHLTDGTLQAPSITLPLAISFYTLHQISYLVDSWHGKIKDHSFAEYLLYVTFFPQLIAGPIVRFVEVIDQFRMSGFGRFNSADFALGLFLFCIGLCKKVLLADYFATIASPLFAATETGPDLTSVQGWVACLSYTFQLYFDFSGYADMAIGLGWLFGIRLPTNFNAPYKAASVIEFWRRWHMTLSRFLRDYLYIPLGGNQKGDLRLACNLVIVMLIGGLWHGAGWTFIVWGGLHGIYLAVNHSWRRVRKQDEKTAPEAGGLIRFLYSTLTFLAIAVAWVFFRSASLHGALHMLSSMAGFRTGASSQDLANFPTIALMLAASIVWLMPSSTIIGSHLQSWLQCASASHSRYWPAACALLGLAAGIAVFFIFTGVESEFIYFQF